ncbi:hypothetical protein FDJ70_07405 [Clostridium botulinum]|nr:hypothetical protein [Clostridium botulinum]
MFVNLQPFTHNFFNANNAVYDIEQVIIKDCKMDEIKIDEDILEYIAKKEEWSYDTVLLGKFHNNLEVGNIDNNGMKIEQIKLKKRNIENMRWMEIATYKYNLKDRHYNYKDRLVEALEIYEYAIQPITGGIAGDERITQIECDFDGAFIVGKDEQFRLIYNMGLGDFEQVKKTNLYEPLGSKYPILIENGDTSYKKTSIKALLVTDLSANGECETQINRRAEKRYRQRIENFFNNGQPFVFKDSSGNYILARNTLPLKLIPNNDLNQRLYEINLDICEIGDAYDDETLKRYGFLNNNAEIWVENPAMHFR